MHTRGRVRAAEGPAGGLGRQPPASDRLDQHADRARVGDHQRLPVLLLPADTFAGPGQFARAAGARTAVLRRFTVNDACSNRCPATSIGCGDPEQLPAALLGAMRVLTDPSKPSSHCVDPPGCAAQAHDWPESLFAERTWHIARPFRNMR